MICQYLKDLLATDKSQHFVQPRPIIVHYFLPGNILFIEELPPHNAPFLIFFYFRICGVWCYCYCNYVWFDIFLWTTLWKNKHSGVHFNLFLDWFVIRNGM